MLYSKTINPLHFEDLEPHRFEDLVRQLIYEFRDWKSIQALGRLGSDDGIDILATDIQFIANPDDENDFQTIEREWIVQCKREKHLGPKRIEQIVINDLSQQKIKPYGYILVTSSDVSKKSRDRFKEHLNFLGVEEFYIFGKAELEDLLFQPRFDHILFTYFGLSLKVRSRNPKTSLASRLTAKKKLIKVIGDFHDTNFKNVMIKPEQLSEYPLIESSKNLIWRYYEFASYQPIDSISFYTKGYYAYVDWETEEWDILDFHDFHFPEISRLYDLNDEFYEKRFETDTRALSKWNEIEERNKGHFVEIGCILLDRILLIDEVGDFYNEGPHIIVNFVNNSPFDQFRTYIRNTDYYNPRQFVPDQKKRIRIFK